VELPDDLAREAQRAVERHIDACFREDLLSLQTLGFAGEEAHAVHAVTAEVHERTAVGIGTQADVLRTAHSNQVEAVRSIPCSRAYGCARAGSRLATASPRTQSESRAPPSSSSLIFAVEKAEPDGLDRAEVTLLCRRRPRSSVDRAAVS
jgi:hypothetical protein